MTKNKQVFHVRLLSFELFIPGAQSLKQKRSYVHGLKDQIKARFNVSVAELNFQDKWQRSVIGVCLLGNDRRRLESDAARVQQIIEDAPGVEIVELGQEWL